MVLVVLAGCGGGAGGGTASGTRGDDPVDDEPLGDGSHVTFLGFSLRLGPGLEVLDPPFEDPTSWPPSLGAPLDTIIVFHFSGAPSGPFDGNTLPVFTTTEDVAASVFAPAVPTVLPALGTWVPVGDTVEFRPQLPLPPMQATASANVVQKPGFYPGSRYTARVPDPPQARIANLVGPGGEIVFGTTSHPAAFYPPDASAFEPPRVTVVDPPAGSLHPGVFEDMPPGAASASFPVAPRSVLVTYAGPLDVGDDVLSGGDLDHDGVVAPTWALRSRATRLLVPLGIPAGVLGLSVPTAAITGLVEGVPGAADASDVVLHGAAEGLLPTEHGGLVGTPRAMAVDRDPSLLWVLSDAPDGSVGLSAVDHVLGDPSAARHAVDAAGQPTSMLVPLLDPVGLVALHDGRLLVFDRATRRLHELLAFLVRRPSGLDGVPPGAPSLLALSIGDGAAGFRSEPFADVDLDVLDLLQAPSGALFALARHGDGAPPALHRLADVDPDLDGIFASHEGLPVGDVSASLPAAYVAALFESEQTLLALDSERDVIERVELASGASSLVVSSVAERGWGTGGVPARDVTAGVLEIPARASIVTNAESGAVVRLEPAALLPFGERVDLVQRNLLASLHGVSLVNGDSSSPAVPLGVIRVAAYETPLPTAGPLAFVDDVFLEAFDDTSGQDPHATDGALPAHWAAQGGLRASVGAVDGATLGDFVPAPPVGGPTTSSTYHRTNPPPEPELSLSLGNLRTVLLDTDAQNLPMADGSTPGIVSPTTVSGGEFVFRDVVIPEGVRVLVRGSRPLRLTATGRIEIHGLLDVSGTNGSSDDTFDSGFVPVPGGPAGPGAGRGGDGHPTRFDPEGPGTIDQYVTPETGEPGYAPFPDGSGALVMQPRGGRGGLSTVGYDPTPEGLPRVPNLQPNSEYHRPPGGGGGSFLQRGRASEGGSGSYRVQSESSWFPFTRCQTDDKIHDALYGNDENAAAGLDPHTPLQCVYLVGDVGHPERLVPGAAPGDPVFEDDDRGNDFIGVGGELSSVRGGQGGGGGGSRVVSLRHTHWAAGPHGEAEPAGPPYYPKLFGGVAFSPTLFDSKGAAGGGGGGGLRLRAFGDIVIGRTGLIDASGGHGGGGEVVGNCNLAGGGGGGSGGAILLQAGGTIRFEGDAGHRSAGYVDVDGDLGAGLDVSGGFGRDARTSHPGNDTALEPFTYDVSRGDGGQGGFGLIQVQALDVEVDPGVFLFARQRAPLKLGSWTGDPAGLQADHPDLQAGSTLPVELRYVDMLHHRDVHPEGVPGAPGVPGSSPRDRYLVLNGTWPPIIPRAVPALAGSGVLEVEHPEGSGTLWSDTRMLEYPEGSELRVVEEPEPQKVMRTYNGYETVLGADGAVFDLVEIANDPDDPDHPGAPGTTWVGERIPLCLDLQRPDGTPPLDAEGNAFAFEHLIDRLPVVPLGVAPPPLGAQSVGTSRWMAFPGAALRPRDVLGRTSPFLEPFHGTFLGGGPDEGRVLTAGKVPGLAAHYVLHAGLPPFDPGLFGSGSPPDPPYNDFSAAAPELALVNALADGTSVRVVFQGAHPVRPGALVPEPETLSAWVADPSRLDGFGLLRFRIVFDVAEDPGETVGPSSPRPRVDDVRIRMHY